MRRLLILPAVGVVCVAEIYRRGFAAPLLFGINLHRRAIWERTCVYPETEPDYMA